MFPQVALVGRANVGKSSLFNRIIQKPAALVASQAGVTRDLLFSLVSHSARPFILIDSPGHTKGKEELDRLMAKQAEKAWQSADLILFVCENPFHSEDQRILALLRKTNNPILLVVNKLDHQAEPADLAEFYQYGLPLLGVSAQSGLGIKALLTAIRAALSDFPILPPPEENRICFALLGRPNVGKSTLTNRLTKEERQLVSPIAGTTRDSVSVDLCWHKISYRLIDTAGLKRKSRTTSELERLAIGQALSAVYASQVVLLLLDATSMLVHQDMALLQLTQRLGKALVIAINKSDLLRREQRKEMAARLMAKLGFVSYADIHFISAIHNKGMGAMMRSIHQAHRSAGGKWKTHQLNQALGHCLARQQSAPGFKLRYAHQVGTHPPCITIHGKRLGLLPVQYKRYLQRCLSNQLKLRGVPLRLEFKTDTNPYI